MKDTQTKPVLHTPKTKPGLKKVKMPAKKIKESKLSLPKIPKGKKNLNSVDKKPKIVKDDSKDSPKRKRGRPRNDDKTLTKKQNKEQKALKSSENKPGRKRKALQNGPLKNEKNSHPPTKKLKTSDTSISMNGNLKMPVPSFQKPTIQRSITNMNHSASNNISNGGTIIKKNMDFCPDKPTVSTPKSVTFHPSTKSETINGNGTLAKPFKCHPATKNVKSILKSDIVAVQPKVNSQASPKVIKAEKANSLVKASPVKLHPQRMASLDALAKMHVICIPDRKPVDHHPKASTSVVALCSEPFTHQKSLTQCHERIQFDVKKESKDSKGNLVHKQINYVKEKQQVFVSHSVEQSKTVSTIDKEKTKKKSSPKLSNSSLVKEGKSNQNTSKSSLKVSVKGEKSKSKVKDPDKKCAKPLNKTAKVSKKNVKDTKLVTKGCSKKTKKVEQTKSEVKVKETIRMQKTCTYQSVTTVNSHGTTNSSVVPVSHVGLTTNYSKTKKTVVTDEECKNKINYSSGSAVNNSYCVTSESPCSVAHHPDYYKFHAHSSPPLIPFAHVQTCALGHGLGRTSDSSASSSASHCDGNFAVHRFGHQQAVIYPSECSCCCPNSIVQNLHDSCLLRKSIVTYPHHPSSSFSTEALCPSLDLSRHRSPPPAPHYPPCCCDRLSFHHKSTVPCEQSPLDLSLASAAASAGSPLCCGAREVLLVPTPFQQKTCCRLEGTTQPKGDVAEAVSNFVPAKREKSLSPKQPSPKVPKKRQFAHGWSWKGKPRERMITLTNDSTPCPRMCYPSVQHEEGDVINEKDCVLLRSGPKDTDLPYVAKVAAFWENPEDGEMMMSLLWYYRPEHTDQGRKPGQMEDEVFASRHKDVNSIACIEDKCYVLTYNEYCRYRASLTVDDDTYSIASMLVPEPAEGYPRKTRLPSDPVSSDIVFVCRYVYDFRQKRTLKNPT